MTTQRLKKLSKVNNIKLTGKQFNMAEMIQESYRVSYKAKQLKNKELIRVTESHLINVKKNPMKTRELSSDLEAIKKLVRLGECNKFKSLEEVSPKKVKRRKTECAMKPAVKVDMKESWQVSRSRMSKALKTFRESAKTKVFYKELGKFNNKLATGKAITISEAINLYKASNSCLTHLTVELDRNPKFISTFKECTSLLSRDNLALLEAIQKKKVPSKSILESFAVFTNILLECDAPETLDKDKYPVDEDADMETLKDRDVINEDDDMETIADRDVINEDDDMETLADRDVIDEDADMETVADRDVIDEDADMETLKDRDVINEEDDLDLEDELEEEDDIVPTEDEELEEDGDAVTVDLTPDEVALLRKILQKVSGLSEEADLVPDEEKVPELDEEDDIIVDDPELEEDEDILVPDEEEIVEEDEDILVPDEELEEEDEEYIDPELEEEDELDIPDEEEIVEEEDEIDLEADEDELEEEDEVNPEDEDELAEEDELEVPEDEELEENDEEDCDPEMEECNESEDEEEEIETGLSESAMKRIRRGCY